MKNALSAIGLCLIAVTGSSVSAGDEAVSALATLKAGNARFVADTGQAPELGRGRREALAAGQHPIATIVSCADSRVPPEYVFNTGLGDLFVVRVAGEVTDRSVLASVEYAAEHLNVPLLVVMGHEICGAVKAAVEGSKQSLGPNLDYLVRAIRPSVTRTALEQDRLKAAILANVEQVISDALRASAVIRERAAQGQLQIVGAYYELASGKVTFSQPVTVDQVKALVPVEVTHHGR